MLIIAAPTFDLPSETFVRNHVRTIAPGDTALLCFSERGTAGFKLPALTGLRSGWRSQEPLQRRLLNVLYNRWSNHVRPGLLRGHRQRLLAFFGQIRPTAVLAEYGPTGCQLLNICVEAKIPLYVHFHGYDASGLLRKHSWRQHYHRLFKTATGIIVPSRFLEKKLLDEGCPQAKLHLSPCGIDPDVFRPGRRVPHRLIAVGRLVEKKAPHLTIAAFARIAERFPQAKLEIVGDGPLARKCTAAIREFGLEDRVRLHGAQSPEFVANLMQSGGIFVQHSVTARNGDTEGLPVSLLEAMSCELPVVATRHSGIVETVEQNATALLVDEYDVDGMAAVIGDLLANPARAEAMGKAGRRRVIDHFTLEHTRSRLRTIMNLPESTADTF